MARGGLYKSDVQKARRSLLAQGKHPSVDALRVALGNTGSKTTIHRYLRELEAEEGAGVGANVAVSEALQDLVVRLAARLHEEAEAQIATVREEAAVQLKASGEALELANQQAAAFSAQLQRTERDLAEERAEHQLTQTALQEARVEAAAHAEREAGLALRLAEQEAHATSLEDKHAQAREALEHFRTSAKEQRDQEHRRHEAQVQGLQAELRHAAEALSGKNHELLTLNRDAARLTEQVGALKKDAQQAQADARRRDAELGELQGVRDELAALKVRWTHAVSAQESAQAQLQSTAAALEGERAARSAAEARAAAEAAGRAVLEQVVARFELSRPAIEAPGKTK